MDRRRWFLLSLALVPCAVSFISWCSPAAPAAVAAAPKSALAFSQYALNLKETKAVATVRGHFRFNNCSAETVKITNVKPSCGCVMWTLGGSKRTYGPGEEGRLDLVLPTANEEPGHHEYTVTITYNDGAERTTDVKFNVDLPAKSVRLEPAELYFYQYGQPLTRTLRVIDDRNKVLDIVDAKIEYYRGRGQSPEAVPAELAEATIEPSEITAGRRATPIRIDVSGDVAPKEKIAHLVITTNDPDFKQLKVPMLIQPQKKAPPVQQSSVPAAPGVF
jgi:hypothetical protein